MCFLDPWPCICSAVTHREVRSLSLFGVQVHWAVGPGVSLQLITVQPGRGLGKRFDKASFLLRYLPHCCLREVKCQQGKELGRAWWW